MSWEIVGLGVHIRCWRSGVTFTHHVNCRWDIELLQSNLSVRGTILYPSFAAFNEGARHLWNCHVVRCSSVRSKSSTSWLHSLTWLSWGNSGNAYFVGAKVHHRASSSLRRWASTQRLFSLWRDLNLQVYWLTIVPEIAWINRLLLSVAEIGLIINNRWLFLHRLYSRLIMAHPALLLDQTVTISKLLLGIRSRAMT